MADEELGRTVLCEAMEYLARLATNLGSRTVSMKEKRINKSKLRDTRSVKNAAEKVLLLCQLSKKSIENVEKSIKEIIPDDTTDNKGGKTDVPGRSDDRRASTNDKDLPTSTTQRKISGKITKLKYPKHVNVNHYKSVKVLAKSMPYMMMNKYPVYINCKLYRERKRQQKHAKNYNCSPNKENIQEVHGKKADHSDQENEIISCQKINDSEKIKNIIEDESQKPNNDVTEPENSTEISSQKNNDLDEDDKIDNESKQIVHDSAVVSDSSSSSFSNKRVRSKSGLKRKKTHSSAKLQSSSDEEIAKKGKKNNNHRPSKVLHDSSDNENNVSEETKEKHTEVSVIELDSDSEDKLSNYAAKHATATPGDDEIPERENDENLSVKDHNDNSRETETFVNTNEDVQNEVRKDNTSNQDNADQSESAKPLIKCVNISKLLKPSVASSCLPTILKPSSKVEEKVIVHMNRRGEIRSRVLKIHRTSEKRSNDKHVDSDDSSGTIRSKSQVKNFVPREFTINLVRISLQFTTTFLQENNLKRITENDSVICAMPNKNKGKKKIYSSDSTSNEETVPSTPVKAKLIKAKNALLNDSDEGDADLQKSATVKKVTETEKIKESLLGDSDSDKNENASTKPNEEDADLQKTASATKVTVTEKIIESFLGDSDSDKNENASSKPNEEDADLQKTASATKVTVTEKIKESLLGDSDSDKNENACPKPNEEDADLQKTASATKVTETEKIKESLLGDSDSDKNEIASTMSDKSSIDKISNDGPYHSPAKDSLFNNSGDEAALQSPSSDNRGREIKESLLGDSDSDKNEVVSTDKHVENFTESLLNDRPSKSPSKSMSPVKETSTNESHDKKATKSAHLNDSGSSNDSSEMNKKQGSDKKSKRKHIMESMRAKKLLLTYSSSSDTEDEQLKAALKDIQDSLLKDISSEQEKNKQNVSRNQHSSDSDEDISNDNRKRRKIRNSNTSGSDKETKNKENTETNEHDDRQMGRSRESPDGSGSHNSDTPDDKVIEGLTNLKSLHKTSRTRSKSGKVVGRARRNMSKTPLIRGEEGLLEAPSSDEDVSGGDSDGASDNAEEDLPPIKLSGLNGEALGHLAKDDLLGDSESDSSKDKSPEKDKKEDDSSEPDNIKSKRRKALAISSDSEAGSSKPKEHRAKLSDFEDSEEESSEPANKNKRKKIANSDSDGSAGSSSDGGKKKRRRIKQINDSEGSGSDTENEGKSKHGRKNIRKVMGKNQLEEATKKAAREERERVARIAERQKTYNNLEFDESGKPDEVILDKVVLDFDPETKEPLIEVDRGLVKKLKPHQANGIKFMWDACFESVKRIKKDRGSGCILAHCMGLGKTLQVVSLTHTLLTHSKLTNVNRVLVVCPLSTVLNWVNEFKMWLKHAERDYEVDVYELSRHKQNAERAFQLSQWFVHGGVCVLGYEMFRNLSADNTKKYKKKMLRQLQESLVDPGPDLVVCDEGHLLKNEKTSLSQSMNRIKTRRRIVLTGTPLQNNLKEYYCMVQFVKPNLLGKYNEYLNRFVNPITNGQYTDSTEHDIRIMKRRSHVLHKMLDGAVQRRDYGVLAPFLPPKHEYVLFITLTEVQTKLYQHYLDNYSRRPLPGKSSGFLFPDFQSLQRIWTHPLVLKYNSERYEIMQQKKRDREEEDSEGSLVDFIDDDSTPDETSSEDEYDSLSDMSDDSRKKSKKKKAAKKNKKENKGGSRRGTRANPQELVEAIPDPDILEVKNDNPTEWWIPLVTEDEIEDMKNSHKLVLLFEILRQCEAIGDKLLVFSQSLYSLDLIEHFLGKVDEATQEGRIDEKLGGHVGSWSPGIDYFRLDGSTSCENRSIWCKNFNREDNPRARLFLISTRAGGLGINLVAANRVIIFDVSWNPSHDVQSIFRVYRFGQKKPCYVYRFLAMGTMEEKIYERQVTKQAISKRVIDEQQIDRHYAENDLAELYKFEPSPTEPRPIPLVPKDRLFAEMLKDHENVIYKFHEHDSLLENKEEETLSEEERKAAWDDFENEKNRPPPAPFPNWPMNGMVPNLLAQQQQQLAYAALAQMLRKDMPNLSDDNIRNMLPIIYGSNPGMFGGYDYGLMQKMADLYKYTQPGMMNPAMMNPMMNAGGGAAGGMSGSSGLQYEPPWQRQQQQQSQMRLQQLLSQQNQMGAKFYAGGLGSRDPIAMALQQQRAREIMVGGAGAAAGAGGGAVAGGGGAGRPRGRPPLQPRAPPALTAPAAPPQDIVNLDSD